MKMPVAVFFLLCAAFACGVSSTRAEPQCGDFLEREEKKPQGLEFLECRPSHHSQLRVLQSRYRVKGEKAVAVEDELIRETGLRPLRFVCCFWESAPDAEGNRYGRLSHDQWGDSEEPTLSAYEITMSSEETPHSKREDWPRIEWFYVHVDLFLEIP